MLITFLGVEIVEHYQQRQYSKTDVMLLCFSVDNPQSFVNVQKKWLMEAYKFAPEGNLFKMSSFILGASLLLYCHQPHESSIIHLVQC